MSYRPDSSQGAGSDYSPPPVTNHKASDPGRDRKIGGALIVIGLVILIAGAAVAVIPMSWKSASDIVNDWEGGDIGYFKSYDEGSKVTVLGEITFEIPVAIILGDTMNYSTSELDYYGDLQAQNYHYVYFLDNVYDLEIYSKTELGDAGDEVSLELTLNLMDLGGMEFWTWTGKSIEKPNATIYYALGIPILILGLVAAAFGAKKYLAAKKSESVEPQTSETQFDYTRNDK